MKSPIHCHRPAIIGKNEIERWRKHSSDGETLGLSVGIIEDAVQREQLLVECWEYVVGVCRLETTEGLQMHQRQFSVIESYI